MRFGIHPPYRGKVYLSATIKMFKKSQPTKPSHTLPWETLLYPLMTTGEVRLVRCHIRVHYNHLHLVRKSTSLLQDVQEITIY